MTEIITPLQTSPFESKLASSLVTKQHQVSPPAQLTHSKLTMSQYHSDNALGAVNGRLGEAGGENLDECLTRLYPPPGSPSRALVVYPLYAPPSLKSPPTPVDLWPTLPRKFNLPPSPIAAARPSRTYAQSLANVTSTFAAAAHSRFPWIESIKDGKDNDEPGMNGWIRLKKSLSSEAGSCRKCIAKGDMPSVLRREPSTISPASDDPPPGTNNPSIEPLPPPPYEHPPFPPPPKRKTLAHLPPNRTPSSTDPLSIAIIINGLRVPALLSTVLRYDCLSARVATYLGLCVLPLESQDIGSKATSLKSSLAGQGGEVLGKAGVEVWIGSAATSEMRVFHIVEMEEDCILGLLFLREHGVVVDGGTNSVEVDGEECRVLPHSSGMTGSFEEPVKGATDETRIDDSPTLTMGSLPSSISTAIEASHLRRDVTPRPQPILIQAKINNTPVLALIDSTSRTDMLSPQFVGRAGLSPETFPLGPVHSPPGHPPRSTAPLGVRTIVDLAGRPTWDYFDVSPVPLDEGVDVVLGMPYLRRHRVRLDIAHGTLEQNDCVVRMGTEGRDSGVGEGGRRTWADVVKQGSGVGRG